MNLIKKTMIVSIGVILAGLWLSGVPDKATEKIMPFVSDDSMCQECHGVDEREINLADPAKACDKACGKCHKEREAHHAVGMEVDFKVPEHIRLGGEKRLACISCHDLKTNRMDDKPWKSKSLFGRIFRRQTQYKTYYLVTNNSSGKLCKSCH